MLSRVSSSTVDFSAIFRVCRISRTVPSRMIAATNPATGPKV